MMPNDDRQVMESLVPAGEAPAGARVPRSAPSHSKKKRSAGEAILDLLGGIVPKVGDGVVEIARKCVFMLALLVLIGSVSYLLNDMVVQPAIYEKNMDTIRSIYTPGVPSQLPPGAENYPFPEGMSDDFKALYMENNDLRGYLKYTSTMGKNLFEIDYPVLQTGDNDYYLDHDFYKTKNKQGALFFDYRNNITLGAKNKNLIIYGHNLSTGQMFTYLNKLITKPNKNYARSAPTMTMNTIYEQATYKVFAVMVVNNNDNDGPAFRYLRTDFTDDTDFLRFVAEIRARSVYDYDSVDVQADDELLMLSTCNGKGQVHFEDGRTVVVARKVRPGESAGVDTSRININDDVIMPYAWYVNQGLAPHVYYTDSGYEIPNPGTTDPGSDPTRPIVPPPTSDSSSTTPTGTPDPGTTPPTSGGTTDPNTSAPPPTDPGTSDTPPTDPDPTGSTDPDPTDPTDPSESTDPAESTDPTDPDPTDPVDPPESTDPPASTDPTDPDPTDPPPDPTGDAA